MLFRIPLLLILFYLLYWSGAMIMERLNPPILLKENPLARADLMLLENQPEQALLLSRFGARYLPLQQEYSASEIAGRAEAMLNSPAYFLERFSDGALTGDASDTASLLGTLSLDMFVLGDIRDLAVQGYREFDSGDGDEVIMALSATGLVLTLTPELSWAPSLFKTFWRGNRFSKSFQREIRKAVAAAIHTGDYRHIQRLLDNFSDVIEGLGPGPAMAVFRQVKNTDDLSRLAVSAKHAPDETFTLVNINGISSLGEITSDATKTGKLSRHVRVAVRQAKILEKSMNLITLPWLVGIFLVLAVCALKVVSSGRRRASYA